MVGLSKNVGWLEVGRLILDSGEILGLNICGLGFQSMQWLAR